MTGIVSFLPESVRIGVLKTDQFIVIPVTRTGDLTGDASVNILLRGSDFYYPSAGNYDGLKYTYSWAANEGGIKEARVPVRASAERLAYLDFELVDFVRCAPGTLTDGNAAIYEAGITPSWIPNMPGKYIQQIIVTESSGIRVETVPIPGDAVVMVGSTATMAGKSGLVPVPAAGTNNNFLAGDATFKALPTFSGSTASTGGTPGILQAPPSGVISDVLRRDGTWGVGAPIFTRITAGLVPAPGGTSTGFLNADGTFKDVAAAGIASIKQITNPGGDIDLIGSQGIAIVADNTTKKITIGLPVGTADKQALVWDNIAKIYKPGLVSSPLYAGATMISPGIEGLVTAPPAGVPNRYPAADGTWRTEGSIPNQSGGANGKVLRITSTANTWTEAYNTDTVDQLFAACLCFKQGGQYFKSGSVVTGLSGLITGKVYYLDLLAGAMTTVVPTPSATTRKVCLGAALASDTFLFAPGEVITGG